MKQSFEQCDLYSSPIIDAVRRRSQAALAEEIHRLIQYCVQANLPIGATILKIVQNNREYCRVCIPDGVAWLDQVLDGIFEAARLPSRSQAQALRLQAAMVPPVAAPR
ncbi:MAG: hypothetical protein Q6J44_05650 [Gloeomargarita sp. DG02_4_bins_56]